MRQLSCRSKCLHDNFFVRADAAMLKSCKYCGRIHPEGYICPAKPRYDKPRLTRNDKFRRTAAWLHTREAVLDRDYHMCRICNEGSYGTYAGQSCNSRQLSVHHIVPLSENFDLRTDEDNLLTCCAWHHKMCDDGEIPREYQRELAKTSPRWVTLAK